SAGRLTGKESRQLSRDGGIGRIREAELLKTGDWAPRRHLVASDQRKKAVDQHLIQLLAAELPANRVPDQLRPFSEHRDRMRLTIQLREQRLFCHPTLVPQRLQLPRINPVTFTLEALLHDARQGEVHVVAAEQNVIANRDALEREISVVLAHQAEAEIGGAASDVAHEQEMADSEV